MSGRRGYRTKPKVPNATFTFVANNVTDGDSTLTGDESKQTEVDDNEAPVVFLCGSCRQPIGDSLSWAGSDPEQSQILLHCVSDNVLIGKEPHLSETRNERGCLIVHLTCRGCSCMLGMLFTSTPKKLDYKRSLFFLDVAAIESYVLGTSSQQAAVLDTKEQPVTMEYKQLVEEQLAEIKDLTVTMGQRLMEIEAELHNKSVDVM